jgi:hypothetical protein
VPFRLKSGLVVKFIRIGTFVGPLPVSGPSSVPEYRASVKFGKNVASKFPVPLEYVDHTVVVYVPIIVVGAPR